MGIFSYSENNDYDESVRQTGFDRYRQLLSAHGTYWMKINLLTIVGVFPLAAGIALSVLTSSILILIPCSIVGGMIFGPFLAGLYDVLLRGLREAPEVRCYQHSWKRNWKEALLPGALFGLLAGINIFLIYMLLCLDAFPGWGTIIGYFVSIVIITLFGTLYWPQLVLFRMNNLDRLKNVILFTGKHLWRVLGVVLLQVGIYAVAALFAPGTLVILPVLGFWYPTFVAQLMIYDQLNLDFCIEERMGSIV